MIENQEPRQRTVTWEDPLASAAQTLTQSGLEYMRATLRGEIPIPPISRLLGLELLNVEFGRVMSGFLPAEYLYDPIGNVHSGMIATVMECAMSGAVYSTLPKGMGFHTLDLQVNYLKTITQATGYVRCIAKAIHRGKDLALASARLYDERGTLYAHGTTSCLLITLLHERGDSLLD